MHAWTGMLAAAVAAGTVAPERPGAALLAAMQGRWTGALEYVDYQPPHAMVRLPTRLLVTAEAPRAVRLDFTYDDGPGKTVRESESFALDDGATGVTWGAVKQPADARARYSVQGLRRLPGGALELVCERQGEDGHKPATIRETLRLTGGEWQLRREVSFAGGAFSLRHRYLLVRGE